MIKLKTGYVLSGIVTGCILLFTFFSQLPDGKLHIVFCDVGQGDAAYITFPNGKDMLIDGGPGGKTPKVLECLGKNMSLFDRRIDIVLLTHPEEDHLRGLEEVLRRYDVTYFLHSDVRNTTKGYAAVMALIHEKHITERIVATGETISIGSVVLSILWPEQSFLQAKKSANVLGVTNVNDASVVMKLTYGTFDVLFPGDADSRIDPKLATIPLQTGNGIEVLKVPHHGAKTAITDGFISWIGKLQLAVISVGKNMYGHPSQDAVNKVKSDGARVIRTDESGEIEVVSDGISWNVQTRTNAN